MQLYSFLTVLFCMVHTVQAQDYFYPEAGAKWEQKSPESFGLSSTKIKAVVSFAQENEYSESRDLRVAILRGFSREPYHQILGPTKKRGGPAGMILKNGYVIAAWGDTQRVDMTFSVTKSYLATVAGLALQEGHIQSLDDNVYPYVWDHTFDGAHNQKITWTHLLHQTSDWSGQLWGGYDSADRPPSKGGIDDWKYRTLNEPGTYFKYNDVRVNVLAYSLLQVWRKALPVVLKEKIMDPIGASNSWRWFGYDNSWVVMDGYKVQSVSGGGHSGGGLFINTEDHARFGLLYLSNGKWQGKQLLDPSWIKKALEPAKANPNYGMLWWLNNPEGSNYVKTISDRMYYAAGFGGNFIMIFPEEDMVIVTRWLEPSKRVAFLELVAQALD